MLMFGVLPGAKLLSEFLLFAAQVIDPVVESLDEVESVVS